MLRHLHVEHFALIDDLDCAFQDNMNVIIGETGAGKSILMDAINLLLGGKSDFEKIRNGQNKAFIEGEFILNENTIKKLEDIYGDYLEDNVLIISRSLDIKGKSTQRINSHIVPLSVIKNIAYYLIDRHYPKEELFFYDEKKQIEILDSFIRQHKNYKNDEKYYLNYNKSYQNIITLEKEINKYETILKENIDKDYLLFQLDELEKADLKENELEELESQYASLSSLSLLMNKVERFLTNSDEGINSIFQAKRELDSINDDSISSLKEKYVDAYYLLDEAQSEIKNKFEKLLQDSQNLDAIKDRLFYLRSLKRKYGSSTKEMLEYKNEIKNTLDIFENASFTLEKLKKEREKLLIPLENDGEILTSIRKKYALELAKIIDKELSDLLFSNAHFKISFYKTNFNKNGTSDIRFLLSANKGMEALALKDSISLGESSRLLLAFKKVFFKQLEVETMIFDEIDIGLSGKAALALANKIKEIASLTQVLVISHLGQVASKGDHFYLVKKEVKNETTISHVINLTKEKGYEEIAKMINNGKIDEASLSLVNSWLKS